jgi:hypothetical protein
MTGGEPNAKSPARCPPGLLTRLLQITLSGTSRDTYQQNSGLLTIGGWCVKDGRSHSRAYAHTYDADEASARQARAGCRHSAR